MKLRKIITLIASTLGLLSACSADAATPDPFAWPAITREQKPWAYWWWMGSAVDKTNITRSLQRYHDAGMGGVHIIPIYGAKGWETNYITYLSPKWMEMMGWAVSEARRLDMDVDMTTGTGWCFGGGPYVGEREGNANVVWKTYDVVAGAKLTDKFDAQQIQSLVAFMPDGKSEELTGKISADGSVDWAAPTAGARVYAISQRLNVQKVKRPAPGGEGPMLNLIYPDAMKVFLRSHTEAFDQYAGPKPRAQYHDSYEYRSDWSPDFFASFEKRRGYKLQNELPAFFSTNQDDHSLRVKADYRETVSDIIIEDSLPQWVKWSHDRGFVTRNEAHGSPGNLLDLYALSDEPETEMFNKDRNKFISKFASSAAHVTGKKYVGCETGTWLKEHFTEKLSDMKYLLDDLFLSGVNRIYYHGNCYSPDEAPWPGWVFYASYEMNPRNAVWHDVPALNAYAARCSAVLQSGQPDNDILLDWPIHDFWQSTNAVALPWETTNAPGLPHFTIHAREWFEQQPIGKTAEELWNRGYSFDYVSDRQLQVAKVVGGKIQMPGGNYKVIVVPECKLMSLETFKQLLALAENGAKVVFEKQLPVDVSGADNLDKKRAELKFLKSKLVAIWNDNRNPGFDGYHTGKGSVYAGMSEPGTKSLEYENEVACEPLVGVNLSYIRRSFDGGWNYFIANRSDKNFNGWISFDRPAKSVVILDPLTGNSGVAASRLSRRSVTRAKENFVSSIEVHLQLNAGDSLIMRAFANEEAKGAAWNYWQANGQPVEIAGQWDVKFIQGGPEIPAPFQTSKLGSWTGQGDTNAQSFAGTARYSITFNAPSSADKNYFLNLGEVSQSARVKLNGKDYGTLITPPFRVVVDNLKPTGNVLEVEVTSTSANRIRDLDRRGVVWQNFYDINFVNMDYKKFDASNWPLTDSGLLGPVTLTALVPSPLAMEKAR